MRGERTDRTFTNRCEVQTKMTFRPVRELDGLVPNDLHIKHSISVGLKANLLLMRGGVRRHMGGGGGIRRGGDGLLGAGRILWARTAVVVIS